MNDPAPSPTCEPLEVVNDRDEVVGRATRADVHRLGLKHRAAHVLVFNRDGQLFLQKRSHAKDCFPGAWDTSAAGHVDPGESYDACAVRELREELGCTPPEPPAPLFKLAASPATGEEFVWVYRCEAEGPFRLHPGEIDAGGWFALETLDRWLAERPGDFAGTVPVIWEECRRRSALGIDRTAPGGQKPSMIERIAFIVYPVRDIAKSRAFYEGSLGLKVESNFQDQWIEYDVAGTTFAITTMDDRHHPGRAGATVAFEVGDLDAAAAALKARSVRIVQEPASTPVCRFCIVSDPDDNELIIHQCKPAAAAAQPGPNPGAP